MSRDILPYTVDDLFPNTGLKAAIAEKTGFENSFADPVSLSNLISSKVGGAEGVASLQWDGERLVGSDISIVKPFVAGEDLTKGQAVFVSDGAETQTVGHDTGDTGTFTTITADADYIAQTFTTPTETGNIKVTKITVRAGKNGDIGTITCAIRATSGGQPTGADLATKAINISTLGTDEGDPIDFEFATPLTLTGSTKYAAVFFTSAGASSVDFTHAAGGSGDLYTSADSGGNWSTTTNRMGLYATLTFATSGSVYRTHAGSTIVFNAADSSSLSDSFIGFVDVTTLRGQNAPIIIAGQVNDLTSITTGANYYLGDGYGTIATTAGTVTRKVGIGLSTTSLLITNLW